VPGRASKKFGAIMWFVLQSKGEVIKRKERGPVFPFKRREIEKILGLKGGRGGLGIRWNNSRIERNGKVFLALKEGGG